MYFVEVCERKSLEDRISELLEELIVHMVSMLTMQEAGRTSVLSKRWRYVWAYVTVLNFDASDTLDKLMLTDKKLLEVEKLRFLSWVNQVVGSYKGPTIDAFRVVFDLSLTSGFEIDNWVKFALEKRVKQLALCSIFCGAGKQTGCYTSRDLLICNSLTCLNLYYVNVTGQVDNCPSLKYLLVVESKSLETLEVEIDFNVKHTMKYVDRFPQCKKLKELIVSVDLYSDNDLVCFATLIKACPNLQKFKMLECERKLLEDRISELPEELIVHMVSMLTMKEAGRTSVLSKRWRYVWAYVTALTFDASDTFDKLMWTDKKSLEVEKLRFLSWLNQILESYKGPAIDAFRVVFDLSVVSGFEIDNWVKFAMEKRVKKFELCSIFHVADKQTERYTFRDLLIWNSLTDLTLAYVNVTGEVLRSFLDNCRSLEYLSVTESKSLETLEASGAILNLKGLMIYRCFEIKHIEICAPNLVLFMYFGPKISFPFERFSKLTKLSIGGKYGEYLTNNFLEFSSCLSQLEFLVLEIDFNVKHAMKSVDRFPQCKKLKELIVVVDLYFDIDLVCFAAVIKACPNLQKFEIELYWNKTVNERDCIQVKREACPHGNLKIVEIEGFIGHAMDLELIMYLVENCVALEKIVVHLCEPVHLQHLADSEDAAAIEKARMQAENLRAMLKHGIDLIII